MSADAGERRWSPPHAIGRARIPSSAVRHMTTPPRGWVRQLPGSGGNYLDVHVRRPEDCAAAAVHLTIEWIEYIRPGAEGCAPARAEGRKDDEPLPGEAETG